MGEIVCKSFHELTVDELYDILSLRVDVFVVEQKCAYRELDDIDKKAMHVFMMEDGKIVSYLRYFKGEGDVIQIGRVVSRIRKHGYASAVLAKAIAQIKEMPGISAIVLEAQVYAVTFYEKTGFVVVSEPFDEDGIMHVRMERTLNQA